MNISIAIDGPSGAGKSTVADEVAAALGVLHLDTGAMYRAFAWYALEKGVDSLDEDALVKLTESAKIEIAFEKGGQRTLINGTDVTLLIRTQEISMAASNVSKFEEIRRFMVRMQQQLAQTQSMILDGRDIGTTVLPNASLKIFLTASPEVRARRRFAELEAKAAATSFEEVLADVQRRDLQDSTRAVEPLRPADDAVILDTSSMNREEVVKAILNMVPKEKPENCAGEEKNRPAGAVSRKRFSLGYRIVTWICCFLFHTLLPVKYHNLEKAQIDAPYILIGNHSSMLDPLVIAYPCKRYQIRFFGKKELMKVPVLRSFLNSIRLIPVDRHNMDMAAVRACMKALHAGDSLCIFPEGTRHKEGIMQDLESGAAIIALRAKVPLLPAYVSGKPKLFRRIHCYYGDPICVEALAARGAGKENSEALLDLIRETYEKFVREHAENT